MTENKTRFIRDKPLTLGDFTSHNNDLTFFCCNGAVKSSQLLFASWSKYLAVIFDRFQVVEFEMTPSGDLLPSSRRKSNESIEILLPDFTIEDVKYLISFLTKTQPRVENLAAIRSLIEVLQFNVLLPNSNTSSGRVCETVIKQEVLDEIESKTKIHKENEELFDNEKDEETDRETQITTTTNTAISKADQRAIDLVIRENKRKRAPSKNKAARKKNKPNVIIYKSEDTLEWTDIPCIYCGREITIAENKQTINRRRYMSHLAQELSVLLFEDVAALKGDISCSYEGCSFKNKSDKYIEHLAVKHQEFYIRVDEKIKELSRVEADDDNELMNLSEWILLKQFFMEDLRVVELAGTSSGQGPQLWFHAEEINPENLSKSTDANAKKSTDTRIERDITSATPSTTQSSPEKYQPPMSISPDSEKSYRSIDEFDSASQIGMNMLEPVQTEDDFNCVEIPLDIDSVTTEDITKDSFACEICDTNMNQTDFVQHVIEKHFKKVLFNDVTSDSCPICDRMFPAQIYVCLHMSRDHNQLMQRIDRYINCGYKEATGGQRIKLAMKKLVTKFRQVLVNLSESFLEMEGLEVEATEPLGTSVDKGVNSPSSSEYSYTSGTCAPGIIPPATEKIVSSAASSLVTTPITHNTAFDTRDYSDKQQDDLLHTVGTDDVDSHNDILALSRRSFVGQSRKNSPTTSQVSACKSTTIPPTSTTSRSTSVPPVSTNPTSVVIEDVFGTHYVSTPLYECKKCRYKESNKSLIIQHILDRHISNLLPDIKKTPEGFYVCHLCPIDVQKKSSQKLALLSHFVSKHVDVYGEAREHMMQLLKTTNNSTSASHSDVSSYIEESQSFIQASSKSVISKDIKRELIESGLTMSPIRDSDNVLHNWSCKLCHEDFTTEEAIRKHVVIDHLISDFQELAPEGQKIYTCGNCHNYANPDRKQFVYHLVSMHSVIEEEKIYRCIRESQALVLDIDVIRCRCGKSFSSDEDRNIHILSTHFKERFSHIPKPRGQGQNDYKCQDCGFQHDRRSKLIQHMAFFHKCISKQDLGQYIPGTGGDFHQLLAGPGDNGTDIDFNDSVSQLHLQRVDQQKRRMALNMVLKCPICHKVCLNQANFEDHLGTHGIRQEPVFHCTDCNFAASFANQFYHLQQVHKEKSSEVCIRCLCCDSYQGEASLPNHSSSVEHSTKAQQFVSTKQLFFTFRYSCEMCSLYFKDLHSLDIHLNEYISHKQNNKSSEPVFQCKLCNQSKGASVFSQHINSQKHVFMVSQESAKYPKLYGLSDSCQHYSCETCKCAHNFKSINSHVKDTCHELKCGPCDELLLSGQHLGRTLLLEAFRKHVHSDKHKNCVNIFCSVPANKFNSRYIYQCTTCLFVFLSQTYFSTHAGGCVKGKYKCLPCDKVVDIGQGLAHISSQSHKDKLTSLSPLDTDGTQVVDLEQSPRQSPELLDLEIIESNSGNVIENRIPGFIRPSSTNVSSPSRRRRDCDTVVLEGSTMEEQSVICLPENEGSRQKLPQPEVQVLQTNQTVQSEVQVLQAGAVGSRSSQPQLAPNRNVQQSGLQVAGTRNLQQPSVQVLEVEEEMEIEELEQINAQDDEQDIQEVEQDIQEVDRNDNAQDQDIQEVEHEIEEIEENDIQEISQVDSAANDIQEISPQQSTSQNQFKKPTNAMPRRRTPQKGQGVVGTPRSQPTTAGGGLGRESPQGANNRKPQLATPGSQEIQNIQSVEERTVKRRKKVYACQTAGCTVVGSLKDMTEHALSHLRRNQAVVIRCTVCKLNIKGPGIVSQLNSHGVQARHKKNLVTPA